jgi:hypothetical protein
MGLDQYAYCAMQAGVMDEYYSDENHDKQDDNPTKLSKPRELAYWRKHPNLQGWMEQLWIEKGRPGIATNSEEADVTFNGIELELVWEDLERLELDVISGTLPPTNGFFFGNESDEYYREQDLDFIKMAKAELFVGIRVFYNSSW